MDAFRNAFKRKAKMQSERIELPQMHWRHKENGWEVVSTTLHNQWDNAKHPENHDGFEKKLIGGSDSDDGFPRFNPNEPTEWETFHTDETHSPMVHDRTAVNQFESAFRHDIDYMNAEEAAEFLHGTFEAEYTFDSQQYDECSACDGTGRVCDADDCLTYCHSGCGGKHDKLRVSDDACDCSGCNYEDHWVECDDCNGKGRTPKGGFTRTFPYTRDKILSEMPSKRELQVLQFTINKMAKVAEQKDTTVSFRKVLRLFDVLENGEEEDLINQAIAYIEPTFRTIETPIRSPDGSIITDERGKPVMQEKTDPEAIEQTKVKLTATLNDITEQQAKKQYA